MLIEGPGGLFDGIAGWLRRRSHVVGARPDALGRQGPTPRPARRAWFNWRVWPPVLAVRDRIYSLIAQGSEYTGLPDVEFGAKGIRRGIQFEGLLPWSAISVVEIGFARDEGGVALLLTSEADVSILKSMEARAERRLVLAHGLAVHGQRYYAEQIGRCSPETVIRRPEVGPLVAPLHITNRPNEPPPYTPGV